MNDRLEYEPEKVNKTIEFAVAKKQKKRVKF